MTQTVLLIDAAQPGVLDLGEVVLFNLGHRVYAVSLPVYYTLWQTEQLKEALLRTLGDVRILLCKREEGQRPSFSPLQDSADLKTLLTPIVKEILETSHG